MKSILKIICVGLLSLTFANATPHVVDTVHSEVGFSVKHLMITNVKGEFKKFDGEIDFDYKTKKFNKLVGIIEANSVNTGIEKRDNHLRSADFFYAEKYPQIKFEMKTYKQESPSEGKMLGDITIRGVTKPIELEVKDIGTVKDLKGNNRVGFTLEGKINRTDFGLKWNKALEFGGIAVGEEVKIIVDISAVEK
ncbi:MAG: YceI family protein [Halarcobacter sp.]